MKPDDCVPSPPLVVVSALLAGVAGIHHGFGIRVAPLPAPLLRRWDTRPDKRQIHGTAIAHVNAARQRCGEIDGMFTTVPRCLLHVGTADCVPVLLARRSGGAVAALHCGWRSTFDGIVARLWTILRERGEHAPDWVAAIGPAIGPCCYEVGADLVDDFRRRFPHLVAEVSPRPCHLDLQAIVCGELVAAAVGAIDVAAGCTHCSRDPDGEPLFASYRRDGPGHVMWSAIVIDDEPD